MPRPINAAVILVYVTQQGKPQVEKEEFYVLLQEVLEVIKYRENVRIMDDWNNHVGWDRTDVENIIESFG